MLGLESNVRAMSCCNLVAPAGVVRQLGAGRLLRVAAGRPGVVPPPRQALKQVPSLNSWQNTQISSGHFPINKASHP